MAKSCKISNKKLKEIIQDTINRTEKPVITDIIEIIRPFYSWNRNDLIERELRNKARYIMSTFKDDENVRTYFLDNNGIYINVEKSTDLADLDKVNKQLSKKYSGLSGALAKVQNRIKKVVERYSLKKSRK